MTTREELDLYFAIRALVWNNKLATLDAKTVAAVVKTLRVVREDVRTQLLESAGNITDWNAERLAQIDAWASQVLAGAAGSITGSITEASIVAATASLAEYNAMMSLDGASPVVKTVGFTREQLVTWFRDTDIFEGMNLTTRVDNAMSAGAKDEILEAIRKAGVEGKGTAAIVQSAIDAAIDAGFQLTEREAVTLARSYVQAANVGAMDAVMEANKGLLRGWRWAAKLDNRVCPRCAGLDGTFYKIDAKDTPPMPRHFNCLTGETPVFAPDKVAAFVSTYRGPVFEIVLSSGASLTTTANHMFLTPNGFSPAKSLYEGQEVFFNKSRSVVDGSVSKLSVCPNDNRNPARIDKVIEAFSKTIGVRTVRVPCSSEDLHGDMEFGDGYVDIIASDSFLRGDFESFRSEHVDDFPFVFTDAGKVSFPPLSDVFDERFWLWNALNCRVGGETVFEVFLRSPLGHHKPVGLSVVSNSDRIIDKNFPNHIPANTKAFGNAVFGLSRNISVNNAGDGRCCFKMPASCFSAVHDADPTLFKSGKNIYTRNTIHIGDLIRRFSSFVSRDHIVKINKRNFSGHVYDLQTLSSLYYTNGTITSNCRCLKQFVTNNPKDFGVPDDEVQRVIRPWVEREPGTIGRGGNRKILNAGTTKEFYGEWFKALPAAKQEEVVGPTRAKLLREGKLKWSQLIDKATGRYRTLDELGFKK